MSRKNKGERTVNYILQNLDKAFFWNEIPETLRARYHKERAQHGVVSDKLLKEIDDFLGRKDDV